MDADLLTFTDPVADVGILVAFAAAATFVVSYAVFFNWRLTHAGRSLVYFVLSLLSVAFLSLLARWVGPDYWGRGFFRPITWWAVAITTVRMTYVLWRSFLAGRPLDIESKPCKTTGTISTINEE